MQNRLTKESLDEMTDQQIYRFVKESIKENYKKEQENEVLCKDDYLFDIDEDTINDYILNVTQSMREDTELKENVEFPGKISIKIWNDSFLDEEGKKFFYKRNIMKKNIVI